MIPRSVVQGFLTYFVVELKKNKKNDRNESFSKMEI